MALRLVFYLLAWLATVAVITQAVGWWFADPPQFDGVRLGGRTVYMPGRFVTWRALVDVGDRWLIDLAVGASLLCALIAGIQGARDATGRRDRRPFGADRWATARDVRRSGLLGGRRHDR